MDSPTLRIPSVGSMEKGLKNTWWHDQNILPTLGMRRRDVAPDLQMAHIQLPAQKCSTDCPLVGKKQVEC